MSNKVEFIIGYVEKPIAGASAGTSLVDQYNSDKSGFALVNQSAQTAAAVASVTSIVKLTAGFVPYLNTSTNTLAGTTTLLKITADYKNPGSTVKAGDMLALVGNVAGVVASVALLAGATPAAAILSGVGIAASAVGLVQTDAINNLFTSLVKPLVDRYFSRQSAPSYAQHWITSDLQLMTFQQFGPSTRVAVAFWNPYTHHIGLGGVYASWQVGDDFGIGHYVPPSREYPEGRIDIGPIEIVPPPKQDGYGCVGGSQDGYH